MKENNIILYNLQRYIVLSSFVFIVLFSFCFCSKTTQIFANAFETAPNIVLCYNENEYKINFAKYAQHSDIFYIQQKNQKWGRDGNLPNAISTIKNIVKMGFSYEKAFEFVFSQMPQDVSKFLNKIQTPPQDSKIIWTPNFSRKISVSNERIGFMANIEEVLQDVLFALENKKSHNISIRLHKVLPNLTRAENLLNTQKLASFSTDISKSSVERKNNVKRALRSFKGMIVAPEQTVSFNKTTGRRTEEKGYEKAHIIMNELFVDGVGGGVCQSSTTLYNALILSDNVKILQANRHSMPVSYIQLGFDAMVSYGSSDLVFKNTSTQPIYIDTYSKDNRVYVEIYGRKSTPYTTKRRTEILKTLEHSKDDKLISNDKGEYDDKVTYKDQTYRLKNAHDGYEVQTYLDYYDGDKLVSSKPIRKTTYPAQDGIVVRGTKDRPSELDAFDNL